MRPIASPPDSVNQSAPSAPAAIDVGDVPAVGTANSVMTPPGVMRPIRSPENSVNHRLPSGPATIPYGWADAVGTVNSVMAPPGVIRPIRPEYSVNQRLP